MLWSPPLRSPLAALAVLFVAAFGCQPARPAENATPPTDAAGTPIPQAPIAPVSAQARTEDERNTVAVFKHAAASTVYVTQTRVVVDYLAGTMEEVPAGSGSGFVWDRQGHIVTNFHVVERAQALTVTFQDQQIYEARVVGLEPRKDIAVLRVNAPQSVLVPIHVPEKAELEVGQKTIAIGNPFGLDHTLTTGVVSALGRQVSGIGGVTIRDMIQTDAAINPGNSGGPLLDSAGQLIGMNTMIFSKTGGSAGIGFAVPVSTIARVVPQIIKNGKADQLSLGIQVDPQSRIERRLRIKGVVVVVVPPGSSAERAGLRGLARGPSGIAMGDVIVAVDDKKVESYDDLYAAIDTHRPGDKVQVRVQRAEGVKTLSLEVVLTP